MQTSRRSLRVQSYEELPTCFLVHARVTSGAISQDISFKVSKYLSEDEFKAVATKQVEMVEKRKSFEKVLNKWHNQEMDIDDTVHQADSLPNRS